jgi:hypothetical protein
MLNSGRYGGGCAATSPYHRSDTDSPGAQSAEAQLEQFIESLMQRGALGVIVPQVQTETAAPRGRSARLKDLQQQATSFGEVNS